jgi:hypothetical protein
VHTSACGIWGRQLYLCVSVSVCVYVCVYVETEEKREPSSDSSYKWTCRIRGTPLLQENVQGKKIHPQNPGDVASPSEYSPLDQQASPVCVCVCVCVAHTFSYISNTCYAHFLIHIKYILVYQRGLRDSNASRGK